MALRDSMHGPATCILCGAPGSPSCHVVRRSQGGMGVEQNLVTLCDACHKAFDEGTGICQLERLGFCSRKQIEDYIVHYIKGFYPDWTPESVTYCKGAELVAIHKGRT